MIEETIIALTNAINDLNRNMAAMSNAADALNIQPRMTATEVADRQETPIKPAETVTPAPIQTATYTDQQLATSLGGIAQAHGTDAALGILKQFNAVRVTEIPAGRWGELASAIVASGGTL